MRECSKRRDGSDLLTWYLAEFCILDGDWALMACNRVLGLGEAWDWCFVGRYCLDSTACGGTTDEGFVFLARFRSYSRFLYEKLRDHCSSRRLHQEIKLASMKCWSEIITIPSPLLYPLEGKPRNGGRRSE